jgi:pilus assembly protein Flp/PilA
MNDNLLASFRGAAADRKGVTAAEYAFLAVGVIIVVGAAVATFGTSLTTAFTRVGTEVTTAMPAASR